MDFALDGGRPTRKLVGIGVVIFLHMLVVYALVTGLARKVVDVIQEPVITKIVTEIKPPPPPPAPEKPAPPIPKSAAPPPPYVPPPEVKVQQQPQENTIAAVSNVKPPTNDLPTSVAQPLPAATQAPGPPAHTSARVAGNCEKPEYPRSSLRNEEQGTVDIKLIIGTDGRVVDAVIEKSSGFKDLDRATLKAWSLCHFTPAMADGQPVQSATRMQYVWKLE
jgi:protein TonB